MYICITFYGKICEKLMFSKKNLCLLIDPFTTRVRWKFIISSVFEHDFTTTTTTITAATIIHSEPLYHTTLIK